MRKIEVVEQELAVEREKLKSLKKEHETMDGIKTRGINLSNYCPMPAHSHSYSGVGMLTQKTMEGMMISSILKDIKKCEKRIEKLEQELAELQMN